MISHEKVVFLIQASPLEWSGSPSIALRVLKGKPIVYWVAEKLKMIIPPSQIVLTVPDIQESVVFSLIAQETGVQLYLGSRDDVLARLTGAMEFFGAEILGKVIGQQYFIDCDLLESMILWLITNELDYLQAPDGFDVHFWGEVGTLETLKRVAAELSKFPKKKSATWRTRPLSFVRLNKNRFNTGIYEDVPLYPSSKLTEMREVAKQIYTVERAEYNEDKKATVGNIIMDRYRIALKYVGKKDRVLDIACGLGYGTDMLAGKAGHVTGADYSPETIQIAKEHNEKANVSFEIQDITSMNFSDNRFDVVISMETICHVDENKCLSELLRVLKPGGTLIISAHQNINGRIPIVPWHLQEYSLEDFKRILAEKFVLQKIYGEKLGVIDEEDERGEYMIAVCKNNSRS